MGSLSAHQKFRASARGQYDRAPYQTMAAPGVDPGMAACSFALLRVLEPGLRDYHAPPPFFTPYLRHCLHLAARPWASCVGPL